MKNCVTILAIAAMSLAAGTASAAVLMSEPFDNTGYASGNLIGQPGAGSGSEVNLTGDWASASIDSTTYTSVGLIYSYTPSQTAGTAVASGGAAVASRSSDGAFDLDRRSRPSSLGPNDYFFSMLMRYDTNGGLTNTDGAEAIAGFHATNDLTSFDRSFGFGFRNNGGTIEAIMRYQGSVDVLSSSVTPGTTYFVAAVIDNNASGGSADPVTAYFNPTNVTTQADAIATSTPVTRSLTGPHGTRPYQGVVIYTNDTFGDVTFDELLMGQEWVDVTPVGIIPEPATAGLLGLAGLALLRRRRTA